MMIKKLVYIKNYSKFKNFNISKSDWDGVFKKVNIIYAPNGSGKTSFSVLLRSIKGNPDLIMKKKTFDSAEDPSIKFILNSNQELKFYNSSWNKSLLQIEVFDSFYLDENLYVISIDDDPNQPNIFELSISEEIQEIKEKILSLKQNSSKLSQKITNRKNKLRSNGFDKSSYRNDANLINLRNQRDDLQKQILDLENLRLAKTENQRQIYKQKINSYLSLFCDNIKLSEIKTFRKGNSHTQNIVYGLEMEGHNITIAERNSVSLKYFLSDGDKNALALSFFLAKIDMLPNKDSYIIIVDDPFTSFDSHRKMTTITQLTKLASKVEQFFLLTHDLHFANDFVNACTNETLNLKLSTIHHGSVFMLHNIKLEMLTGFNKDIMTLRNYLDGNIIDEPLYLREVVRCIRPTIEGIFKIKYYNYITETQWLGDFISLVRSSTENSPFYRLRPLLDELEEINDYSKIYHHSNPNYLEVGISPLELKNYVRRTLYLIEQL